MIAWFAPFFMIFEVAQIVIAQRYIGLDQIRRNAHPLDGAASAPPLLTIFWLSGLMADYVYQVMLLFQPNSARLAALLMLLVSAAGFGVRRGCGLKWGLVVLTVEGAARAGFMGFVFMSSVIHPGWMRWTNLNG